MLRTEETFLEAALKTEKNIFKMVRHLLTEDFSNIFEIMGKMLIGI